MKYLKLPLFCIFFTALFSNCSMEDETDREEIVEMTIYPETGYGGSVMSEIWTEPLLFSDSEDSKKRMLVDIIFEGSENFNYERGYEYTLKVKKVWMQDPPQDVSSIKYVYLETLSKEKAITQNRETKIEVTVSDRMVRFMPRYPTEYEEIEPEEGEVYEQPKVYDALYMEEDGDNSKKIIVTGIDGFNYEEGYHYRLSLSKKVQAEPYDVTYSLLEILSKEETD